MSSLEIEDVLASIRRLVSDDLRPANRPTAVGKLMLTPALRVVPSVGVVDAADAPLDRAPDPVTVALRDDWVPDRTTLAAVTGTEADHLDFASSRMAAARFVDARSALLTAAEAFHAQADEFVLSYSDSGSVMLRGDAPASAGSSDHGAVFAVLNTAHPAVVVPPVQVLVDAEGGAPVEDDASWSTVEWDDTPEVVDSLPPGGPRQGDATPDGPLILPFVSARRSFATHGGGDVLTLRSPILPPREIPENPAAPDAPGDTPELRRLPKMKAKHLAARVAAAATKDAGTDADAALAGAAPDAVPDRQPGPEQSLQADGSAAGDAAAIAVESGPDIGGDLAAAIASEQIESGSLPGVEGQDRPDAMVGPGDRVDDVAAHARVPDAGADAGPIASAPAAPDDLAAGRVSTVVNAPMPGLFGAGPRVRTPAALAEAAFTRWPGWAQPDPGQTAAASLAPPDASVPLAAASPRKPKAAMQDLGWADRAEAEIHRQLAAELGPSVAGAVTDPAPGLALQLSEAGLRDLVRDMIREELTGKLGERITQNVRKLVQLELQKTMALNVAEFRSQRRDPD